MKLQKKEIHLWLKFTGKRPKNIAIRMQLWRKRGILEKATLKAHINGMRISTICARNTSALAFDGSGKVVRDKTNAKLATFTSGKHYNADLNAAYNIGARYFIREYNKTIPEKVWLPAEAKVPEAGKRTLCTLSTLIRLVAALKEDSSAA